MSETTNADRAKWGREALNVFQLPMDDEFYDEELEIVLADLLADLMHMADQYENVSFDRALDNAKGHYRYEVEEEKEQT